MLSSLLLPLICFCGWAPLKQMQGVDRAAFAHGIVHLWTDQNLPWGRRCSTYPGSHIKDKQPPYCLTVCASEEWDLVCCLAVAECIVLVHCSEVSPRHNAKYMRALLFHLCFYDVTNKWTQWHVMTNVNPGDLLKRRSFFIVCFCLSVACFCCCNAFVTMIAVSKQWFLCKVHWKECWRGYVWWVSIFKSLAIVDAGL